MSARVAVLDDEARLGQVLGMVLEREGYVVEVFQDSRKFCDQLEPSAWDLVITDLKMPHVDGLGVLAKVNEVSEGTPVIVITAHGSVATAIEAMKRGAADYVQKPFDNDEMKILVRRALERNRLARENRYLRGQVREQYALDNVVSESRAMQDVLDLAKRAANSPVTVLVTGDSGTGKELVARSVHYWSDRVGQPFVAVNCKAFASGVLESELFGHEKGAFTGAQASRKGVFERAHGGTVFLDEIGEVDADFQAKLLRVLQEKEVRRVGGDEPLSVNVRVVAATNRDLAEEVAAGRFREDLYFRLAVIPIHIPPLSERRADILPLARFFLHRSANAFGRRVTGWSGEVEGYLSTHAWPGNVRELENAIERAVVLARGEEIQLEDVLVRGRSPSAPTGETLAEHLDAAAKRRIIQALDDTQGRRAEAAELLGIDRTTLYRLMKKHEIGNDD